MRYSIIIFLFFVSCYSVERDCLPFHQGTFEFTTIVNNKMKTSYFLRTANLEIETYEGVIDSAAIRWVNDCECILTKLNPTSKSRQAPCSDKDSVYGEKRLCI